jgi:sugar lactone lactonase YvrE
MHRGSPGNRKTISDQIGTQRLRRARALMAILPSLFLLSAARADTLYVTFANSNDTVEQFTTAGASGVNTDDGPLTTTNPPNPVNPNDVSVPTGIAIDASGNEYVANFGSGTISEFSPAGVYLGVFASGLNQPAGLAFDQYGDLYVANGGASDIVKITPAGVSTVFAMNSTDPNAVPYLGNPNGLAFDRNGNLYVSNSGNNSIDEITPSGNLTVIASANQMGNGPAGVGFSVLQTPRGLAFDSSGNLYVANSSNDNVEEFTSTGQLEDVFAGSSQNVSNPYGLAFDSSGDLFVSNYAHYPVEENTGTSTLEELSPAGQLLDTFSVNNLRDGSYIAIENNSGAPLLSPVPEPSVPALIGLGAAWLMGFSRLRRRRA